MANNFYYRLTILSFIMLGIVICFALLLIAPSYILVRAQNNFINEKLVIQESEPVPVLDQQTLLAIKELDEKLGLVESLQVNKFIVSERIINEVMDSKIPDIKIVSISYENNGVNGKKVSISGTAPSRERLLLFRQALEGNSAFQSVDLPISNFVRGSNIPFYLSLIPSLNAD